MADLAVAPVTENSVGQSLDKYVVARRSMKPGDAASGSQVAGLAIKFLGAERDAWNALKNAAGSLPSPLSGELLNKAKDNYEMLTTAIGVVSNAATVNDVDLTVLQLNYSRIENKAWINSKLGNLVAGATKTAALSIANGYNSAETFKELTDAVAQGQGTLGGQGSQVVEPRKTIDRAPVDNARAQYNILKGHAADRAEFLTKAVRNLAALELRALDFAEKNSLKGLEPLGEFSDPQYVALKAGLQKLTDDKRTESPAALVGEYEMLMAAKKKVLGPEGAMSKSAVSLSGPGGEMASEMRVLYTTLTGESLAASPGTPRPAGGQPSSPGQAGQTAGLNLPTVQPGVLTSSNPAKEAAEKAARDANQLAVNAAGRETTVTDAVLKTIRDAVVKEISSTQTMMQNYHKDTKAAFKQEAKDSAQKSKDVMTWFEKFSNPGGAIFGNVSRQLKWQSQLPDYYTTVERKTVSVFNRRLETIDDTPKGSPGHENDVKAKELVELFKDIRNVRYGATDPRAFGLVNQILGIVNR